MTLSIGKHRMTYCSIIIQEAHLILKIYLMSFVNKLCKSCYLKQSCWPLNMPKRVLTNSKYNFVTRIMNHNSTFVFNELLQNICPTSLKTLLACTRLSIQWSKDSISCHKTCQNKMSVEASRRKMAAESKPAIVYQ